MIAKIYPENRLDAKPCIEIGPRVQTEIKRRIRELEGRYPHALTTADRKELHKLRVFIHLATTGGE